MNQRRQFSPTLKQLRAFVAVYQLGKLSAAATQLFLTQSAVSVLIKQMEEGLGVRLFDRTTRSLQPTPAAHEALKVAQRILRDIDSLGSGLQDLTELRRGRVSVVVTPTLGEILLPKVVQAFQQAHPHIQLAIADCAPDQFFSHVLSEHADFGIGTPEGVGPGLEIETLLRDHLSLVCTEDHPLARRSRVRWKDLEGMPVTTVRPGYGIRPLIELSAAQAGIKLNITHEVTFLSTALWMTSSGMCPAIMPAAYLMAARSSSLVARKLSSPKVSRDICLVYKQGRSLSPAAQEFIDVLKSLLITLGIAQT